MKKINVTATLDIPTLNSHIGFSLILEVEECCISLYQIGFRFGVDIPDLKNTLYITVMRPCVMFGQDGKQTTDITLHVEGQASIDGYLATNEGRKPYSKDSRHARVSMLTVLRAVLSDSTSDSDIPSHKVVFF